MKELKKKIKFFKYYTLFSKNKLFFICLLNNHQNYFYLRKQLVLNNFQTKFIQNGLIRALPYFYNVKTYLTGQMFFVLKDKLTFDDYFVLKNLFFKESHILLFYLDNKFYADKKLKFLKSFFKKKTSNFPNLSYFYFILKLGFILKLEKLNTTQNGRVHMT